MSRAEDIWNQLNQIIKIDVDINEAPYSTTRTTPNLQGDRDDYEGNQDQFIDFPYVEDPNEYQTYKAMEQDDSEQTPEEENMKIQEKVQVYQVPKFTGRPSSKQKDIIAKKFQSWTKLADEKSGTGVEPLSIHFTPSAIYIYYGVKGLSSRNAIQVVVRNGKISKYDVIERTKIKEQEESDLTEQAPAEKEEAEVTEKIPAEEEEVDVTEEMPAGEEPGIPGIPGMEEPKQELTSSEIGKVYELKKIYSRLISIEGHLSATTDTSLLQMRSIVAQAMELFETVIVNFEQYKEQIDEIIVTFYKFLDLTYGLLQSYYKNDAKNEY